MDYNKFKELYHHGVKGMKWGIRKEDDESPEEAEYRRKLEMEKARYSHERKLKTLDYKTQRNTEKAKLFCEKNIARMKNQELKSKERQQKGRQFATAAFIVIGGIVLRKVIKTTAGSIKK